MAGIKITDMTPDASIGGSELIPVSDAGTPKTVTPTQLAAYSVDAVEAVSTAASVTGADYVLMVQGGAAKRVDVDVVAQHAIDTIWAKAAETAPDSADVMALKDGGTTEKTVTLALLAEYVRATIEAAILDVSDLDAAGALSDEDYLLVTQGTTGKYATFSTISTAIYAALADYVTDLSAIETPATTDVLYVVRSGGSERQVTIETLSAYFAAQANVSIHNRSEIGAAVADGDTILVDDGDGGTIKKCYISRLWTYVLTKFQALTAKPTPLDDDILMIQDSEDSNDLKELTVANLWDNRYLTDAKAIKLDDFAAPDDTTDLNANVIKHGLLRKLDNNSDHFLSGIGGWMTPPDTVYDGDIADLDIDGGADIGADLADADLIIVDDGGAGTNRKSAVSRLWTYVHSKLKTVSLENNIAPLDYVHVYEYPGLDSMKTPVQYLGLGIKLDDLATPDDNTDLNASTSAHGLLPKLDDDATHFLNGDGAWAAPAPKLDDLSAPDDNTDLNASTSAHGLLPKLDDDATHFLNGDGSWADPVEDTYDEIWVPAGAMTPSDSDGAAVGTFVDGISGVTHDVMLFDGLAQDESVDFNVVFPDSWDRSSLKWKGYWTPDTGANVDEYVSLSLKAEAYGNDSALDSFSGSSVAVTDQALAVNDLHITAASDELSVGLALGCLVHFKLTRDYDYAGAGDAMDVDLKLLGIMIQFKKSGQGAAW